MKTGLMVMIILVSTSLYAGLTDGESQMDSITGATDMPGQEQIVCDQLKETGEKSVEDNRKLADQYNRNCTSQSEQNPNEGECEDLRDNIQSRIYETDKIRNEYDGRGCRGMGAGV